MIINNEQIKNTLRKVIKRPEHSLETFKVLRTTLSECDNIRFFRIYNVKDYAPECTSIIVHFAIDELYSLRIILTHNPFMSCCGFSIFSKNCIYLYDEKTKICVTSIDDTHQLFAESIEFLKLITEFIMCMQKTNSAMYINANDKYRQCIIEKIGYNKITHEEFKNFNTSNQLHIYVKHLNSYGAFMNLREFYH
jgi:hypothetical protein